MDSALSEKLRKTEVELWMHQEYILSLFLVESIMDSVTNMAIEGLSN